jgi:outer membrane protease
MRGLIAGLTVLGLVPACLADELDGAFLRGTQGAGPVAASYPVGPRAAYPAVAAAPVYPVDSAPVLDPIDTSTPSYPVDAPVAPEEAPWLRPSIAEFEVEIGVRDGQSTGHFAKDLYDDPRVSTNINSRLTYSELKAQSAELFGRIDHSSGFFVKGYAGIGKIPTGKLNDEDFPPALDSYSSTLSDQRGGHLYYASADFGYDLWRAKTFRLGVFVGYQYLDEKVHAYGCTQIGANPFICAPGDVNDGELAISETAEWHSLRLGAAGELLLFNRLRLTADAAWVPYVSVFAQDTHWLRWDIAGPIAERGTGNGLQLQGTVSWQFTDAFSVGVGARYWRMRAKGSADLEHMLGFWSPVAQPMAFTTERFGAFVQTAYRFGLR